MHYKQLHILDKLIKAEKLRNRDMRPPNVDSNLYQYHLVRLQKDGYIDKEGIYYKLSARGLAYADRHSTTLKKTRSQPKLITVVFLYNQQGEVLLVRRTRQPFMSMYNLPSGKIHLNETIDAAARREVQEKIGEELGPIELEHRGSAHIIINQSDFTISDYLAILMAAEVRTRSFNDGLFVDPDASLPVNMMPGVKELLRGFKSRVNFFEHMINIDPKINNFVDIPTAD